MRGRTYYVKRVFILFLFASVIMTFIDYLPEQIVISYNFTDAACSDHILAVPESLREIENCSLCQEVTCKDLLFGDPEVNNTFYENVVNLMSSQKEWFNKPSRNDSIEVLERSCEEFIQWRKYDLTPVAPEEKQAGEPFSIAFNILGHFNFEQTEKLLRATYRPQNSYCFHIDAKSVELTKDITLLSNCFDNVFLASEQEYIIYAGFSRLQADLNCMKDHLKQKVAWKYLINTASTGFPLKTNKEMVEILKIFNGSNAFVTIPTWNNTFLSARYKYIHTVLNKVNTKTSRKHSPPPHNLTIIKGSAYGIFSRPFVEFILNDPRAQDFLKWCKKTYSPDEHFWNTLHHTYFNPHIDAPGGSRVNVTEQVGFQVNWGGEDKCRGKFVRSVCVFGIGDLPFLRESPRLFLNKFDQNYQPLAMECMENFLKYRSICQPKLNVTFYNNLSFVKNKYDD